LQEPWHPHPIFRLQRAARLIILLLLSNSVFYGYSVLTHEAIVDSLWDVSIRKMLANRFPAATPAELEQAHAYVYGACILQDMGYYPFSSHFFSDLNHYVSGDFVVALIRESRDVNEYAFALGALAHYAADTTVTGWQPISRRPFSIRSSAKHSGGR
jgi:hypothetical protein